MPSSSSQSWTALVVVRVAIGWSLLTRGWGAVRGAGPDADVIEDRVREVSEGSGGLIGWWGRTLVLENPDAAALLLGWSATLAGLALAAGAFTRIAGWLAIAVVAHVWVFAPPHWAPACLLATACAAACIVGDAGQRLGLDPWIRRARGREGSFLD